jgi:hypothetical protein
MRAPGVTALLLASSCALGACGDKDQTTRAAAPATPEQRAVRGVVQEALTTTDPSSCTRLVTQALLEQRSGEHGAAAVKTCRDDADEPGATALSIDAVRVHGARASADVRPRGGGLPFRTATLALRKSGGHWKISRLRSGVLDRPAFGRALRRELTRPPDAVPASVAACALRELHDTSDREIARAYLEPRPLVFLVPVSVCAVRIPLEREHVPQAMADCIVRGFRRELTTGALGRRLARDPAALNVLQSAEGERIGERIGRACAGGAPTTLG